MQILPVNGESKWIRETFLNKKNSTFKKKVIERGVKMECHRKLFRLKKNSWENVKEWISLTMSQKFFFITEQNNNFDF